MKTMDPAAERTPSEAIPSVRVVWRDAVSNEEEPMSSDSLRVLPTGATGVIGQCALRLALAGDRLGPTVAPTRRPLPPYPKVTSPVVAGPDHGRSMGSVSVSN